MSDPWGKAGWSGQAGYDQVGQILGALGGGQGGTAGLDALIGQLRQAGLGPQLDSWIGTGGNAPVAPDDLRRAFGDDQLQALGSRMGLGGGVLAALLAQLLPALIDRLSPQGRMPRSEEDLAPQGGLGGILGGILGGGGLGGILGGLLGGADRSRDAGGEVAPPPEAGYPEGKPGWPDPGAPAGGYAGKPGWPQGADEPGGKPGWQDQGGSPPGKPGWPQPGPSGGGSDDPLGDLARSADRLGRRR